MESLARMDLLRRRGELLLGVICSAILLFNYTFDELSYKIVLIR